MSSKFPPLLLTRPAPASQRVLEAVKARLGAVEAVISPLIEIVALPAEPAFGPVILTSEQGARRAGDLVAAPGLAFCVGARTAEVAGRLGFETRSANGNGQDVLAMVAHAAPERVTHIRGVHLREDLCRPLRALGISTEERIAYDQRACGLSAAAKKLLKGEQPVVVPLFSPRSVRLLRDAGSGEANVLPVMISAAAALEWPESVAPVETPTFEAMVSGVVAVMESHAKS